MKQVVRILWNKIIALRQILWWYGHKNLFGALGKGVRVRYPADFTFKNVYLGDHVYINNNCRFLCAESKIIISDYVIIAPQVTIVAGDHNTRVIGQYIGQSKKKFPENDQDVVIGEDVWIGSNVTILKGVKIGKGAVIGAGSVVVKNVPPYAVVVGNPAKIVKYRFSQEEIIQHENKLRQK